MYSVVFRALLVLTFFLFTLLTQAQQISTTITDSNGKVGIGTTSPLQKLHVNGHIYLPFSSSLGVNQADQFSYGGNAVGHYSLGWYNDGQTGAWSTYLSSYYGIKMFTEGRERLRILGNGNVGIGASTTNARLNIEGGDGAMTSPTLNLRNSNTAYAWSLISLMAASDNTADYMIGRGGAPINRAGL